MAVTAPAAHFEAEPTVELGRARALWTVMRRKPLGAVSAALIAVIVLTAIFADVLAPYDPLAAQPEIRLAAPSWEHPFGTDDIGRDVLSRVIYGSRISLWVGLLAVGIGTVAGMIIGLLCGYCEGRTDLVFQRIMDADPGDPRAGAGAGHRLGAHAQHHQRDARDRDGDHSRATPASCAARCSPPSRTATWRPRRPSAAAIRGSS